MVKQVAKKFFKSLKYLIYFLGVIALFMIILAFTRQPYMAYYRLGIYQSDITRTPDYIVLMGAGGMPGPVGLMRCHFTAKAAHMFPQSKIIIALPAKSDKLQKSDAWKMYEELQLRGVDESRVIFETNGTNSFTQARKISNMLSSDLQATLLIVSSPEHMYRCIRTFEKCGFQSVFGLPALEAPFDAGLLLEEAERTRTIKDLDRRVSLRYNVWTYLKYEITVLRELFAIAWYKLRGYI